MAQSTAQSHKRKISFRDLELTFSRAAPLAQPSRSAAGPAQMTPQQLANQHHAHMIQKENAAMRSKRPTDREIPEELADVVVGDGVSRYRKLRDVERRLDAVMMRKRLDVTENSQRRYTRREGVLRIWVSNTAEGQPWQVIEEGSAGLGENGTFDFEESNQATFRVKIEGRLLDDPNEEKEDGGEGGQEKEGPVKRARLSNWFKAITIDFDRNPALQPDGYSSIEWRKPHPKSQTFDPAGAEVNFDTLEFERKSDENINVTINLIRDEKIERFKLSPQLAEILDVEEEDIAGCVQGIWEYSRAMGLQEDQDKRNIVCDEPLRAVSILFADIP